LAEELPFAIGGVAHREDAPHVPVPGAEFRDSYTAAPGKFSPQILAQIDLLEEFPQQVEKRAHLR